MEEVQNHANHTLLPSLFFFFLLQHLSSASTPDNYFIDCGSEINRTFGSRNFVGDAQPPSIMYTVLESGEYQAIEPHQPSYKFIFSSSTSTVALVDENPSPHSPFIYHAARIFRRPSSYKFEIKAQGLHVVRLHFFPFTTQEYDFTSAVFNVSVLGFSLLSHFSVQNNNNGAVIKEYFLSVNSTELIISFSPSDEISHLAFVNAIEVFSAPDNLITDTANFIESTGIKNYNSLLGQVLETVYRINVGGPEVASSDDTLWRSWIPDEKFLKLKSSVKQAITRRVPNYQEEESPHSAPLAVYDSAQEMNINGSSVELPNFNLTWAFPVDSGFKYLVRLHFCDIVSFRLNELYFNVYINDHFAWKDLNLSDLTNQVLAAPYYTDFIADSNSGLMQISVGPSEKSNPSKRNAILNGVEIMKMKGVIGSSSTGKLKKRITLVTGITIGGFSFVCVLIVAFLLVFKQRRKAKAKDASPGQFANASRKISLVEIQLATSNFDENSVIGRGGFGIVYKGVLTNGMKVAVKRSTPGSRQGHSEFLTEIKIFAKIRHRHLLSLIGYCEEQSEMILVYEFMENGTLQDHLYGLECLPQLSWRQRLMICIGSARGLHYLHSGPAEGIIHRDIKSANILLDKNYLAKVADFGISRSIHDLDQSHVTTNVKGSFGYFDPEYFRWRHLTKKSDVFSFGVVLLEVLCARPAVDLSLPFEQVNLANWAMQWQKEGLLEQVVDSRLIEEINEDSLRKFGETVERCLAECGDDRPTMGDVLWNLECVLRLQDMTADAEPIRL
ncbi:probable receptor-like protein kinase At5g24010 [Magnolia sinica]|uniref:probable receptor-like protein kinase At5g24010 n=1 Tax=Magnolia sinica TaxID=86752 RepID=UPI00265AB07B|nr:probable receptor-like protein kinase At5g24010 [Magnolia sinica]